MVGIVLLGVFVLLLALGAPIAVCLGMSSVSAILVQGAGKPLEAIMSVLPRLCSSASSKFVLLAIPFFILSGNVMEKAGISGRLINLAEKCLGHIRGGMAMVCVVVSCFFAAISGSGPATVARRSASSTTTPAWKASRLKRSSRPAIPLRFPAR